MTKNPDWQARAEQAQRALATASQRNTELLERLSGVRVGLAAMMRRSYPAHVSGVEKSLGGHLSDLPDSVLLGYLEAFSLMSTAGRVSTPNDLHEIVRALRDSGFPMEDDSTAVDMAVAIRGGFQAAKYDNERLRKNNRRGQKGPKNGGAHAIQRDLSWAEPQDSDGNSLTSEQRPEETDTAKADTPKSTGKKSPNKGRPEAKKSTEKPGQGRMPWGGQQDAPPAPRDPETTAKFEALQAALLQPAPKFMRDVVSELGSAELAAEWEEEQKGAGNWSFIPPQNKHRQRGALLIPKDPLRASIAGFGTTPWGRAIAQGYKAGRLYDIAVVLSKLADSVVVCGFSSHSVELTYRYKDEMCALIIGLEPGSDPWLDVEQAVGRFLASPGSVQDILVVPCPARSATAVVETLKSAAASEAWRMNSPVRVQGLETWVSDNGRGAEIIPAA